MKRMFVALTLGIWFFIACGEKKPTPEELDHKVAVQIDSVADDLSASTDALDQEADDAEKAIDDLLKDI